jgi:hypothetical protein
MPKEKAKPEPKSPTAKGKAKATASESPYNPTTEDGGEVGPADGPSVMEGIKYIDHA